VTTTDVKAQVKTQAKRTVNTPTGPIDKSTLPLTIFEKSSPGRHGVAVPQTDVPDIDPASVLPKGAARAEKAELPEVGELDTQRHYTHLSTLNFSIANAFYPLGSCTMKYNPLVNEKVCALPGFAALHPMQTDDQAQGMLELYWRLEHLLCEVSGLDAVSIHPTAGAHGELTSLMVMRKYLDEHGQEDRKVILIPDSAHGTNPASCTMAGFTTRELKSDARGRVDMDSLDEVLGPDVAGLMITNPSTLGLFEPNIKAICEKIHGVGGLVYMDGANMNAILGRTRPGDFGVDVMHFNLHKTFSQPHGGGGPGAGPIAVTEALAPYLPVPKVEKDGDRFRIVRTAEKSIGTTRGFLGNSGVVVRSYSYIRSLGERGLLRVSENAVLNANYLRVKLQDSYRVWVNEPCMHEFVATAKGLPNDIKATDIAKRLIDYGIHPPTIYFPLIVPEALMIEPTETESKETLDEFIAAMIAIRAECDSDPDMLKHAPYTRNIGRPDEVKAVKEPRVTV
jgi:glycine dehydrogenase subunit 2